MIEPIVVTVTARAAAEREPSLSGVLEERQLVDEHGRLGGEGQARSR